MALGYIDDSVFQSIAEAIRSVLGSSTRMRPSEMASFIRTMDPSALSSDKLHSILDRSVIEMTATDFSGVSKIGGSAFSMCDQLTAVTVPQNVTMIDNGAFTECTKLSQVTLHDNMVLQHNVFKYCYALSSIAIPKATKVLKACLFLYCSGLTSVTLHDELTEIGMEAFYGCTALSQLTIPASVTAIGDSALADVGQTNGLTLTMLGQTPPKLNSSLVTENLRIIVPKGCVETYGTAAGWSTYASYIEAAE